MCSRFDDIVKLVPVNEVIFLGGVPNSHFDTVTVVLAISQLIEMIYDNINLEIVSVAGEVFLLDGVLLLEGEVVERGGKEELSDVLGKREVAIGLWKGEVPLEFGQSNLLLFEWFHFII
jgi:hypothetical protein